MRAQSELGLDIPVVAIADYERVIDSIDLESIDKRERELRHDVKARIEEFNSLAGHQYIHIGMTSRDLTENIEAAQINAGLELIRIKSIALLAALGEKSAEYKAVDRETQVEAEAQLQRLMMKKSEELLTKKYRNEFLRVPVTKENPQEKKVKERLKQMIKRGF
jgi:adenylosuccinate lyase